MDDSINMVMKYEIDGVAMVGKCTAKLVEKTFQLIKALKNYLHNKKLNEGGELSFKDLNEASSTTPPVMMIPDELKDKWEKYCIEDDIRYHMLADFNAMDGKFPVAIASDDVSKVELILKNYYAKNISESEKVMNSYDEQINEKREMLISATPEDRRQLILDIDHLEKAKEEVKDIIDVSNNDLLTNDHTITFDDYLKTGRDTTAWDNPEGVLKDLDNGGQSVHRFKASDIFKPIRSESLVPDSKINFIIPSTGAMVTRTFHQDDNGLYYSKYFFHDKNQNQLLDSDNNQPIVFSDQYVTTDEWFNSQINNSNYKDLLDQTGILEETSCEYYDNQEALEKALNRYTSYYENINNKKENYSFSNADVEKEIQYASTQRQKSVASAANGVDSYSFEISADKIFQKDGYITIMLNDDNVLRFNNVELNEVDSNKVKFTIKSSDKVEFGIDKKPESLKMINSKEAYAIFNKDKSSVSASMLSDNKVIGNMSSIKGVK